MSPETRAGDAHAARTVAKSESLGTDSLIFCRCEPFETLSVALARKIFLRRKLSLGARGQVRSDARILNCDDARQSAALSRRSFKKCAVYRHFSLGSDFARLGRAAKIFHRDIRDAIARSSAIAGGEAAAIHNIKWIHCYFFSSGVIGIPVQIDSRLHCTDLATIHSC